MVMVKLFLFDCDKTYELRIHEEYSSCREKKIIQFIITLSKYFREIVWKHRILNVKLYLHCDQGAIIDSDRGQYILCLYVLRT